MDRANNFKIALMFAYTFNEASCNPSIPSTCPDAPANIILNHIAQLKPILQPYTDIIAYMPAGFIGQWGEWHDSTSGLLANTTLAQNNRNAIITALLDMLPNDSTVALRYQKDKKAIHGSTAITLSQAFPASGIRSPIARTAHHNDCFRKNFEDSGTYAVPYSTIESQKDYLAAETLYLVQNGETCGYDEGTEDGYPLSQAVNPNDPTGYSLSYTACTKVLPDIARMHWSVLNVQQTLVVDKWISGGCFDTIKKLLGYRYSLSSATFPTTVAKNATLSVTLNMRNEGWARPYNPRKIEIVLRHQTTGAITRLLFTPSVNERLFLPAPCTFTTTSECNGSSLTNPNANPTTLLPISVTVPSTIDSGPYDVLLNLYDPAGNLKNVPAYSIRLANTSMWEASTGFNKLSTSTQFLTIP